jgi:hypothetical protein
LNNVITRVPIRFETIDTYDDERFLRVKIWLMHTGENLNGSYFSKEAIETAIPTLAMTPILGFMGENSDGEEDFEGHKIGIAKKDGEWSFVYKGHAYGAIPPDNNAQFEMRVCEDGVEREFLTCEGLVWTKFADAVDILNRDESKSQSMELAKTYSGFLDKKTKLYNFEEFMFDGACILGADIKPAMKGASVEVNFSQDQILDEIKDMLSEFKSIFSTRNIEGKGGNPVDEKLLLLTQYSLTREEVEAKGINFEEVSLEDLEVSLKEFSAPQPEPTPEPDPEPTPNFSLTSEQLEKELKLCLSQNKKEDDWGWSYQSYYFVDYIPESGELIACDCDNYTLVGLSYTMSGDKVDVDFASAKRKKIQYVDMEIPSDEPDVVFVAKEYHDSKLENRESKITEFETVKSELADTKTQFETLESEVVSLREFKTNFEVSEKESKLQELKDNFSVDLTEEEMQPVFEAELSLEDMEVQLFALVGKKKKANFSTGKSKDKSNVKVAFNTGGDNVNPEKPYQYLLDRAKGKK